MAINISLNLLRKVLSKTLRGEKSLIKKQEQNLSGRFKFRAP